MRIKGERVSKNKEEGVDERMRGGVRVSVRERTRARVEDQSRDEGECNVLRAFQHGWSVGAESWARLSIRTQAIWKIEKPGSQ